MKNKICPILSINQNKPRYCLKDKCMAYRITEIVYFKEDGQETEKQIKSCRLLEVY